MGKSSKNLVISSSSKIELPETEKIVRSVSNKCKFSHRDELLLEHFVLQDTEEEEEWVGNESGCITFLEPRRDFFVLALCSSSGLFISLKVACQTE